MIILMCLVAITHFRRCGNGVAIVSAACTSTNTVAYVELLIYVNSQCINNEKIVGFILIFKRKTTGQKT